MGVNQELINAMSSVNSRLMFIDERIDMIEKKLQSNHSSNFHGVSTPAASIFNSIELSVKGH